MPGQCPAVSATGRPCHLIEHPGNGHVDLTSGWPHPWLAPAEFRNVDLATALDPLRDAPDALKPME